MSLFIVLAIASTIQSRGEQQGVSAMYAVVRTYSGTNARQLFDLFEQRKAEVEAVIRSVPGIVAYTMARSGDGGVTVTVCDNKAGTDESLRLAREWIQNNAPSIAASPPAVLEGAVILQVK
jgi:hypothetical protein